MRREPRLARQQGGAQSLESRQIGDLAAEREAQDGDAISIDVGMLGQQPEGRVGLGHGPRPGCGGGSAVDQAAYGHAWIVHGSEALLAKGLGVPAFIGLLITAIVCAITMAGWRSFRSFGRSSGKRKVMVTPTVEAGALSDRSWRKSV